MRAARCHVCERKIPLGASVDDYREVILRNCLIVRACLRCWTLWPDERKRFPAFGYGRTGEKPSVREVVQLLRETAP